MRSWVVEYFLAFLKQPIDQSRALLPEVGTELLPVALPSWLSIGAFVGWQHRRRRWPLLLIVCLVHMVAIGLLLATRQIDFPIPETARNGLSLFSLGEQDKASDAPESQAEVLETSQAPESARAQASPETGAEVPPPLEWKRIANWRPAASPGTATSTPASATASASPPSPNAGGIGAQAASSGVFDPYAGAAPIWRQSDGVRAAPPPPAPPPMAVTPTTPFDNALLAAIVQRMKQAVPGQRGRAEITAFVDVNGIVVDIKSVTPLLSQPALAVIRQSLLGRRVYFGPAKAEVKLPVLRFG